MPIEFDNIPFVKIYGPEGMKSSDELYAPTRELVRRLVANKFAITYTGAKGVPQFVAAVAKEFGTKGGPFENIVCHIFIGMDIKCLEDLFEILNKLEKNPENKSKIILFDEPGWNIWDRLNVVLTELMDRDRIGGEVFDRIVPTWNLSEVMDFVRLGMNQFSSKSTLE